jgi:ABC-type antimicrobial peptide transport system permease subunit
MQESGQYLLPGELLMLLVVWLVPPLLIGLGAQYVILRIRLRVSLGKAIHCFVATVMSCVVGFVAVLLVDWEPLRWLNAKLSLPAPYELLFMPLAFLVVALVALVVGYVAARASRSA